MAQAKAKSTRTAGNPSNWLPLQNVFQQWWTCLGSSKAARDKLYGLLCDPETRSAKRRVGASGEEIPDTSEFLNAWFWQEYARPELIPDADGGPDHMVVDHTDHTEVYLPEGQWEYFVRRADVERWERLGSSNNVISDCDPIAESQTPAQQLEDRTGPFKTGAAGRPTPAHLIEAEAKRRIAEKEITPTRGGLAAFSRDLERWWDVKRQSFKPPGPPMKAGSIENTVRGLWKPIKSAH